MTTQDAHPNGSTHGQHWQPPPPPAPAIEPNARPLPPRFVDFPTHVLPATMKAFVREVAIAVGCDEAYVAIPALAAAAAAIGNTRVVRLKRGWTEPSIVWAALVGGSGVRKSPPFRAALRPIVDAEMRFREDYEREKARFDRLSPDEQLAATAPVERRILTEDVTIESVAALLVDSPRGVLNARDEIDDWFQGLVRYKGKSGGSDRARWLKLSNAETLIVDRKTAEPRFRKIFVPMASCSISGTIQPGILAGALDSAARESGLAARLLLCMPDYVKRYWTEAEVHPDTEKAYGDVLERLLNLNMAGDAKGRPKPLALALSDEARPVWVSRYNRVQDLMFESDNERRAVLSKLEGYAARFALVLHVFEDVAAFGDGSGPVTAAAMTAGVQLSEWFAREAQRIYQVLGEDGGQRDLRELAEWIRDRGGRCTARDLQRSRKSRYPTAQVAKLALDALAGALMGNWIEEKAAQGGHTQEVFVLSPTLSEANDDGDTCDTRPGDEPHIV
jgi:hypothetical protein